MNVVYPLTTTTGGPIATITGTPSDVNDVPKWISTDIDGRFNLRWESDIAQGGGFPNVGGIALVGFNQANDTNTFSWPTATPTIEGENPNLWEYTAGSNENSNLSAEVAATLIYNGTDTFNLNTSRMDADIAISNIGVGTLTPQLIIATNSAPNTNQILYRGVPTETVDADGTYRFNSTNEINLTVMQGQPLFLFLQEIGASANFTYEVLDIRISYSEDEFTVIGGGDTQFVQHTDTPDDYTGAGGALVRVNGAADALEFDAPTNLYPNGATLLNDVTIPSAEYVLDAVDPTFNYTMPLLTRDLVALVSRGIV